MLKQLISISYYTLQLIMFLHMTETWNNFFESTHFFTVSKFILTYNFLFYISIDQVSIISLILDSNLIFKSFN